MSSRSLRLGSVREGVVLALDALRANRARAVLTILGVVIGVATVMLTSALMVGIRASVMEQLDEIGPTTFFVSRFDEEDLRGGGGQREVERRRSRPLSLEEAEAIGALASVRSVVPTVHGNVTLNAPASEMSVRVQGRGEAWPSHRAGEFLQGRNYLPFEVERAEKLAVLSDELARALFREEEAVGQEIRLDGIPFQVVGVYRDAPSLFARRQGSWVAVPHTTALRHLGVRRETMRLAVVPRDARSAALAVDQVTALLRQMRELKTEERSTFGIVKQTALVQMFAQMSGIFSLGMLVLSSVGLLVGGVGVVGIMLISVTERTREIGVRMALGATRREILWQFLVEAVTVTLVGAVLGMALGGLGAWLIALLTPIPASVPGWALVISVLVSVMSGIVFGIYPASRAARLDPVEALRFE